MPVAKKIAPKQSAKKAAPKRSAKKAAPKRSAKKAAPKRSAKKVAPKRSAKKAAPKRSVKKAAPKRSAKKAAPKRSAKKTPHKRPSKKTVSKTSSGCYFTTVCCDYFGLPDNCFQLETLRNFRDTVMSKNPKGLKLIKKYYLVAPPIVQKLIVSPNKFVEFKSIFNHINKSCELINSGKHEEAIVAYSKMVNRLINKYLNK